METIGRRIFNNSVFRIVAGLAVAALFLAAAGWLVTGPLKQYPLAFDNSIRNAIRQMQSPMWATLFLTVTKLGSTLYLTIIGCTAGIVFLFLRWFRPVSLLIIAMAGQAALHHGFKWLIARPRPAALIGYRDVENWSFPSGHALSSVCLYFLIAWAISAQIENPAIKATIFISTGILVFLIGMSRVYIGIHYPTDVVAGFIAGAIWLLAVLSTDRKPL